MELKFEEAQASRGQFIRVEYAATEDGVFRRKTDLSDGETTVDFLHAFFLENYHTYSPSHWAHEGISDDLPWETVR